MTGGLQREAKGGCVGGRRIYSKLARHAGPPAHSRPFPPTDHAGTIYNPPNEIMETVNDNERESTYEDAP